MTYGIMPEFDYATMDKTLGLVCSTFPSGVIYSLELGVHKGNTSRGIRDFFKSMGRINFHSGIDNQRDLTMGAPFQECNFIIGNTMEVYNQIRESSQHFLFIDASHSYPMTLIDFLLYSDKVCKNGFIALHDTGDQIKPFTDYQGVGSTEDPDNYISCRKAAIRLGLIGGSIHKANGFELIFDDSDKTKHTGGITVVQKKY